MTFKEREKKMPRTRRLVSSCIVNNAGINELSYINA
jgi:hypothetical protein